jgi:hypothetical protein
MRAWSFIVFTLLLLLADPAGAQQRITTPQEQFGHNIGDDYFLVNYTQLVAYWQKLDRESDRVSLVDIGKTEEGRTMTMAVVTSAENQRELSRFQEISRRLARASDISDSEARTLSLQGKAVVWINGGIHADETLGAQHLVDLVYQFATGEDAETLRILNDVILLACVANPDGMEVVSDWYMRESEPSKRTLEGLPVLYQKYAGHDNNRDFYMAALAETRAINRVLYRDWFPQIVYDHHQTAPAGTVMFSPPFRDPFNFNLDPLVITTLEEIGGAMHSRFAAEGKPGVVSERAANYSSWWNGGLRTTPYFHNMIGLLTETAGSPTPTEIGFVASRQLPNNDVPLPSPPQVWHFRQSIEYSRTASKAVLDYASRNKDRLLFYIYRMGKNSLERGSRDHWTMTPDLLAMASGGDLKGAHKAETRDPRGYIIPSDQPDFLTATKFVNALLQSGIEVHRADRAFNVDGRNYPAGSFVVRSDQAFRPHVRDMFEPQNHPNDVPYPGASPTPPYDSAGWTLAYQMGVRFDRILDGFSGPFERLDDIVQPPAGRITRTAAPAGYFFTHQANDAFSAVNQLLRAGEAVYWITDEVRADGKSWETGSHFVAEGEGTAARVEELSRTVGLDFHAVARRPTNLLQLRPRRIALLDRYGGSMASGWARLVLEQFRFQHEVVYPRMLDEGDLIDHFDVLILPDGSFFENGSEASHDDVPPEYSIRTGSITAAVTIPQLRRFTDAGGVVLALGDATRLAGYFGLGVEDALVEGNGKQRLPATRFYIPGSILEARVDRTIPLGYGFDGRVDFFYSNSPVFSIPAEARARGVRRIAWFDSDKPLRSGWALGQDYLEDAAAIVDIPFGKGRVILYGPHILFRAQSHGTFKFLFNAMY